MENFISYFFCFIVEAAILLQYASSLFVAKHSKKVRILQLSILYLVLLAISLLNISWLNLGLYLIANFCFLLTQYKVTIRSAIFHSGIIGAIMGMCELIIYSILNRFTPYFFSQIENFHNKIVFIFLSKTLFFLMVFIVTYVIKQFSNNKNANENSVILLVVIPVTSLFTLHTLVTIIDQSNLSVKIYWMISLSAASLLIINLVVFGVNIHNQKKNKEYIEMQLLLQKETDLMEYYKELLSQNENQSILIHDIKKHLQSIMDLSSTDEKITDYIGQLLTSSDLKERGHVCDNDLLNAIIFRYDQRCKENNVSLLPDIRSGALSFLSDSDITSLFCNLLDNALEAACQVTDGYIELNIHKRQNTPFVLLTLINSCSRNPYSNNGIITTTKEDKQLHGFGLKSINKIVKKYDGDIQMYFKAETQTFHTIITLRTHTSRT